MNILLAALSFKNLTGSELHVYDLAVCLAKRKHTVTILANYIGGEITDRAEKEGVAVYEFYNHPKLTPDIIHTHQALAAIYVLSRFPTVRQVQTIHSLTVHDEPIKDKLIREYIVVRPDIADKYAEYLPKLIWNGVDTARFNTKPADLLEAQVPHIPYILFVGSNDYLRQQALKDISERAKQNGQHLLKIGDGFEYGSLWDVEDFTKHCQETASIFIGRTTIEGWLCGKPAWVYIIDNNGTIQDIQHIEVPKDLTQFNREYMTDRVLERYEEALK